MSALRSVKAHRARIEPSQALNEPSEVLERVHTYLAVGEWYEYSQREDSQDGAAERSVNGQGGLENSTELADQEGQTHSQDAVQKTCRVAKHNQLTFAVERIRD